MRISDWSSDVCSSDLTGLGFVQVGGARFDMLARADQSCVRGGQRLSHPDEGDGDAVDRGGDGAVDRRVAAGAVERFAGERRHQFGAAERSEEHTSELQSRMRISYAVFCLKKKNK